MLFLLLVSSVLDVFGLASLVPVIMAASHPGSVTGNKYAFWIYQQLGFHTEKSFLVFLITAIFLLFLFKNVFSTLISYQQAKFTARLALQVISNQFQKHINLPYLLFNEIGSPKLMDSTLNIPAAFVNGIIRQLFIFFSEVIIVFLVVLGMLIYQPILIIILAVVLVPSMMLIYRVLRARVHKVGVALSILRPISYGSLVESFIGFIELKLAGKQQKFKQNLLDNQEAIQDLEADAYLYSLIPLRLIEMVAIAAVVLIFLYALLFADSTTNIVTIIGLFAAAAYRLMPSMNRLLTAMVSLKQHTYVTENLVQLREYLTAVKPAQEQLSFKNTIDFNHLSFTFPGGAQPVLDDVTLHIKKGEKIGFIGSSGSGKTTLMNLLLRFYQEQAGAIMVDGVPLSEANQSAWYQLVGYVKQDTFLMEATIEENITLRDEQVDPERMKYALEQASLSEFVDSLPDGLKTPIGERGSRLSGGQRQRIGIARALYKRAEVLVLDEATSALDNETEREVSEAINKLSHTSMTIFIIAHRLTTLQDCDRIFELKEGKLCAEYTYATLQQRNA